RIEKLFRAIERDDPDLMLLGPLEQGAVVRPRKSPVHPVIDQIVKFLERELACLKAIEFRLKMARDHLDADAPVFPRLDRIANDPERGPLSLSKRVEVRDHRYVGVSDLGDEMLFRASLEGCSRGEKG